MKALLRFLPIALFLALVGALVWRLVQPGDTLIRSRLVDQPVPVFGLPPAVPAKPGLSSRDLATGKPHLLNLFASWCVPCITELPLLDQLAKEGTPVVGIDSAMQMALGSSGVPETFVVDGHGVIRAQFIGGITAQQLPQVRAALAKAAQ
jgi:cytochrome c biogenesis protein CcmG/thiol:disulfide interchange protein DsbE